MSSLAQVATALQHVLTEVADGAAHEVKFLRRVRKWTGALFVQTLVLGWLGNPTASLSELTQVAAKLGVAVSPQSLAQRFTEPAATLLERVLTAAIEQVIAADPVAVPLLRRFTGVFILDSSTIALPDGLAEHWAGCGGRVAKGTQAALKTTVQLDLCGGRLDGPVVTAGRTQDRSSPLQHAAVPPGAVRLADLGFWSLEVFRRIAKEGGYWPSRLNLQVVIATTDGIRLDLPTWLPKQEARIDLPVVIGAGARLAGRLLGVRVPQAVADERRRKLRAAAQREGKTPPAARLALADWTLLVTNVPADKLSVAEALVLARARWQIELLFKLWKSHGRIDESRSAAKWRVLCEVYAKLIAMVVQHWVLLVGCWLFADRSLTEAAKAVRREATCLVGAIRSHARLVEALAAIRRCLTAGCQIDHRKRKPSTFQLLTDPSLGGLTDAWS
jgi:hypothetical protein